MGRGLRRGGCRMAGAGRQAGHYESECHHQRGQGRQGQDWGRLTPPARLSRRGRGGRGVREDVGERQRRRHATGGVVLPDQRVGVSPGDLGDAADVPPDVKVASAPGIVVSLDVADDCFPDAGPLADLGNTQASPVTCLCQRFADAHTALPHIRHTAHRPSCHARMVMTPSSQLPECYTSAFCLLTSQARSHQDKTSFRGRAIISGAGWTRVAGSSPAARIAAEADGL